MGDGQKLSGTVMSVSRLSVLRLDDESRRIAARVFGLFVLIFCATYSFGSDIDILVVDKDGWPVADVADDR